MIYPQDFEHKIGFDKVRELIATHCLSSLGKEKVAEMTFSIQYEAIRIQLYQTYEFTCIIRGKDDFPSDHFFDVRDSLEKIRVEGTYLVEKELFDIYRSLETIHAIVRFFTPLSSKEIQRYPYLQELTTDVIPFSQLTNQIDNILDKFGKIKDSASSELKNIRLQLSQTVHWISKTLKGIIRAAQSEGLIDKGVSPTLRDGRLVIPISPTFKRKLKGIVHDESATGKTVFIEPIEVVEANNKIRELENEEKLEIVRILTAFTNLIRSDISCILNSYCFLAEIDFIRAKALFALDIDAILPVVEDRQQVNFIHAIHPLLYLSHRKQNKIVVPLDIELMSDRILVISGPNTGGKSVLMKTVGLLQYMLQSGLLIPVSERSLIGIFKDIFLDIGDEQSIENDLSTYSSHLTNMKFMVKYVNHQSLILIDEFGAGTDPQIGGAIAEALLHRFNERGAFGIITTHYQNLKIYAKEHKGILNGAMIYDQHGMQPLFKLSIGNPGSSFAVEIARKIGLPEDILTEVSEKVGQDYIDMDKYLQNIVCDKRYWELKRKHICRQEKRLGELIERYQLMFEKTEIQRREIVAQAKMKAEQLLTDTNLQIERTIREIKEAQAEKEKTKVVRQNLISFREQINNAESIVCNPKKKSVSTFNIALSVPLISVGDLVRIKGQRVFGKVIKLKDNNAVVAFGALKTFIKLNRLERISNNQLKKEISSSQVVPLSGLDILAKKKLYFKPELDVRGMSGNEALQMVAYYIDDAIQCGAEHIRILHGTGTGILRQIIRKYLGETPGIRSFKDEHVQFGGAGITVVEME